MADIIAASGLMRSTIYQYFANKDEIIWALVQEILEHSNAASCSRSCEDLVWIGAGDHRRHLHAPGQ